MNIGLIGVGRHGMRYAKHLLSSESSGTLVAICRQDVEKGQAFAQTHGLHFHNTYQDLIADPKVQAVIVVLHPSLTPPIALEAIQQRKPLLIEKPLAASSVVAHQIVEAAYQANVPLMTAQTLRFDATIGKFKEWAQKIGKWHYLSLTARLEHRPHSKEVNQAWNGRGALLEIGIHLIDIARDITNEDIIEVSCEMVRPTPEAPEDLAWGRLTTQSGLPCLFDVSRISESRMTRIELIGQTGQVASNWTLGTVSLQRQRDIREQETLAPTFTIQHVLDGFLEALAQNHPMPVTGEDGLRAVEIAEACYESAKSGHPIKLS